MRRVSETDYSNKYKEKHLRKRSCFCTYLLFSFDLCLAFIFFFLFFLFPSRISQALFLVVAPALFIVRGEKAMKRNA